MRALIFIVFLIGTVTGFSQSKQIDKIKIPSSKVVKTTHVKNIITDDLGKCEIISYHFSANLGNNVKSFDVKNGDIPENVKMIVGALKAGDKFVVENIRYDCKDNHKKSYVFIIQ